MVRFLFGGDKTKGVVMNQELFEIMLLSELLRKVLRTKRLIMLIDEKLDQITDMTELDSEISLVMRRLSKHPLLEDGGIDYIIGVVYSDDLLTQDVTQLICELGSMDDSIAISSATAAYSEYVSKNSL